MPKKKKHRKHTPITTEAQAGLFGAAYGAKMRGEPAPSYVPKSLMQVSRKVLRSHLKEYGGR